MFGLLFVSSQSGCDIEKLMPNDEPLPVDVAKLPSNTLSIVASGDYLQDGPMLLSDRQVSAFMTMLKNSKRTDDPSGVSDQLVVTVSHKTNDVAIARFWVSTREPRFANDGREYIVNLAAKFHEVFLQELQTNSAP